MKCLGVLLNPQPFPEPVDRFSTWPNRPSLISELHKAKAITNGDGNRLVQAALNRGSGKKPFAVTDLAALIFAANWGTVLKHITYP